MSYKLNDREYTKISEDYNSIRISTSWDDPKILLKNRLIDRKKSYSDENKIEIRKPFDAVINCKSAGIIPYSIRNNKIYFLFQRIDSPIKKKDCGWNDFGGKRANDLETTILTASREFNEETSCLFYLNENRSPSNDIIYELLKDNPELNYEKYAVETLKSTILIAQKYFADKISGNTLRYVSSKETYISYLLKVNYIPEEDIPKAEDIHIPYENRYIRTCKWFSMDEIIKMNENEFHKRLQITKVQNRLRIFHKNGSLN